MSFKTGERVRLKPTVTISDLFEIGLSSNFLEKKSLIVTISFKGDTYVTYDNSGHQCYFRTDWLEREKRVYKKHPLTDQFRDDKVV